jgi:hypothetical protein
MTKLFFLTLGLLILTKRECLNMEARRPRRDDFLGGNFHFFHFLGTAKRASRE